MKKKISFALLVFGIIFVLYAIFGRYLVLPGYLESLENGSAGATTAPLDVEGWKIARYLLWAYAFKLGIYFFAIGAILRTAVSKRILTVYIVGGLLYIGFAYMPLPATSLLFGIGGCIMTVAIMFLLLRLTNERKQEVPRHSVRKHLRIFGYFFFAMATYNLCPLLGVKCFALQPEKMIQYGLQADAASFAAHILIELALGWAFLLLSHTLKMKNSEDAK
jgi:hypothetical protein